MTRERWFFWLYSLLLGVVYLLTLPLVLLLSLKSKYKDAIPARFALWRNPPLPSGGIWFHACSFGEVKAIAPLVEALPHSALRITATTNTGFDASGAYTKAHRFLPFEPLLFVWIRPQKALVVMEAEFWYLLFVLAQKRGAKTLLINARMSDRSYPRYLKIAWLYREIFKHIDEVYAQTELDAKRLITLGAKQVRVTGNIKLSQLPAPTKSLTKPTGVLICGASTHEGEEGVILEAFLALKRDDETARLLVVPRHPERFDRVAQQVEAFATQAGLSWHRYSQREALDSDIVVVDRLGELINLYAVSDIVILGGAFEPIGGHNAAEAAQFGCKILSGKHYFNQRDIFLAIEGIAIVEASNLSRRLSQHHLLKATKIKYQTDITPIVESLRDTL